MKIFAILLSMIVLTLTFVPCCALEDTLREVQKEHKCTDKNDDCCKSCSPFYTCGTCVGFTVNSYSIVTFAVALRPILHDSTCFCFELTEITFPIWQPPKLG